VAAADGDPASTDVLMTSHMRFSAFQGGAAGRITPISLAPELRTALTQEGFDAWRSAGGVVMSDALGVPAIRRFYGADAQNFFNRRVALDAFLAGHDLLYLADFSLDDTWESERANIIETIGFFQDRYRTDADFASRVDQSVRRILRLKLGLYRDVLVPATDVAPPAIPLPTIMANQSSLDTLSGEPRTAAEIVMNETARQGLTILYPDPSTQTEPLPPTFRTDDNILIFTDSRLMRECATCTAEAAIGPDELADIVKRFYGSEATGQIDPARITSLTFAELTAFLDIRAQTPITLDLTSALSPTVAFTPPITAGAVVSPGVTPPLTTTAAAPPAPSPVTAPDIEEQPPAASDALLQERVAETEQLIENADWILFGMLDVDTQRYPASGAVTRFLREYGDELTDQRLVVFAFNAPYFLDTTEMSRLTTYFGVYSKTQLFLENAVRGLFRAYAISGAPPVPVPGTRFADLNERLAPDPADVIPLRVTMGEGQLLAANAPAEDAAAGSGGAATPPPQASPVDVGAALNLAAGPLLDRNGHIVPDGTLVEFDLKYDGEELALAVEPALTRGGIAVRDVTVERSGTLRIAAASDGATTGDPLLVVIVPPPTPTPAPAPPDAAVGDVNPATAPALPERVNLMTLLIALFTIVVTLSLFLIVQVRVLPRAALVHNMLWAAIFGLLGYLMYGLGLIPGANWLRANISVWGTTVVVFVPMLLPLLWLQLRGEE
jgi:beta-N-acetylhexosaminidase